MQRTALVVVAFVALLTGFSPLLAGERLEKEGARGHRATETPARVPDAAPPRPETRFEAAPDGALTTLSGGVTLRVDAASRVSFHSPGAATLSLGLRAVTRGEARFEAAEAAKQTLETPTRVVVHRAPQVDELYEPRETGVEQLFRVYQLPAGGGDLALEIAYAWPTTPTQKEGSQEVLFGGGVAFTYGAATAFDASGRSHACATEVGDGFLRIRLASDFVDAATLPITVDPLIGSFIDIDSPSGHQRFVDVAYSVTQDAYLVVFEDEFSPTDHEIRGRRVNASTGAFIDARFTIDNSGADTVSPSAAWLGGASNSYLVVWRERITKGLAGAIVSAAGATPTITPLATPVAVTSVADVDITRVQVGGRDSGGVWLVVYDVEDASGFTTARCVTVSAAGQVGAAIDLDARFPDDFAFDVSVNRLATGSDNWLVAYTYFDPLSFPDTDVLGRFISVSGANQSITPITIRAAGADESLPSVAGAGADWFVTWVSRVAGTPTVIEVARYNSTPARFGLTTVSTTAGIEVDGPVASLAGADLMVAWTRSPTASATTRDVVYSRFDPSSFTAATGSTTREQSIVASVLSNSTLRSAAGRQVVAGVHAVAFDLAFGGSDTDVGAQFVGEALQPVLEVRSTAVTGAVITAGQSATGTAQNFTATQTGTSSQPAVIVLRNTGGGSLNVSGIALSSGAGDFALTLPSLPASIPALGSVTFAARFNPATAGTKIGNVQITHNATSGTQAQPSPFNVEVRGVATAGAPARRVDSALPAAAIPDNNPTGFASTITVPDIGEVTNVTVTVNLDHTWIGDLICTLTGPGGQVATLFSRLGTSTGSNDANNVTNVTFDDGAAITITSFTTTAPADTTVRPATALATFRGRASAGDWTLRVADFVSSDVGNLLSWSLAIETAGGAPTIPVLEVRQGPGGPVLTSALSATGTARNFGATQVGGQSAPVEIALRNTGTGPLTLSGITFASGGADFALTSPLPSSPIAVGASVTFGAIFAPQSNGVKVGLINIAHDATSGAQAQPNPFVVELRGAAVTGAAPRRTESLTLTPALPITDNTPVGITSIITLPNLGEVTNVTVSVNITHTWVGDLIVNLTSPSGATVSLVDRLGVPQTTFGNSSDNLTNVTFDDLAATSITTFLSTQVPADSTFRPEVSLAGMRGLGSAGTWTLFISDNGSGDTGDLNSWSLTVETAGGVASPGLVVRETSTSGNVIASGAAATGARDLGFGVVASPTVSAVAISLTNNGTGDLHITADPATTSADFTVDLTTLPGTPGNRTIAAGNSATFSIRFTPQSFGRKDAGISFAHDAAVTSPFVVNVTGFGLLQTPGHQTLTASSGLPAAIPDNTPVGVSSTTVCSLGGTVLAVSVTAVNIFHDFIADLEIRLVSPDGTTITLFDNRGGLGFDMVNATFDDAAATAISGGVAPFTGSFRPEQPFSAFQGVTARGVWTLHIRDNVSGDAGLLQSWTLRVTSTEGTVATPILVVRETSAAGAPLASNAAAGGVRNFGQQQIGGAGVSATIFVRNDGVGDLTLGAPTPGTSGGFSVNAAGFAGALAAGQSRTFQVSFNPASAGTQSAAFSFTNDGFGAVTPFVVNFSGEGVAALGPTFTSTDVPKAIADTAVSGTPGAPATSTINIGAAGFVTDVNVRLSITHTFVTDLVVDLTGPDGTTVTLADREGTGGADMKPTVLDDQAATAISAGAEPFAGTFQPRASLSAFNGRAAAGLWTLRARDFGAGDTGTIDAFALEITVTATGTPIMEVRDGATLLTSGAAASGGRAFATRGVNDGPSAAVTISVTNVGTADNTLGAPTLGGANPGDFVVAPGSFAGTQTPAGAARTFTVAFDPTSTGAKSATVSFDNGTGTSPFVILLTGTGAAQTPAGGASTTTPKAIVDLSTITDTITVNAPGQFVVDVKVTVDITHTFVSDVILNLQSPAGTIVNLVTQRGGSGDDMSIATFLDSASTAITAGTPPFNGTFRPEQALATFFNESANGGWTLSVQDAGSGDVGSLRAWSLEVTVSSTPAGKLIVRNGVGGPTLTSGATLFDLGIVEIGTTGALTRTLQIANTQAGALTISAINLTGAGAADFDAVPAAALPLTLAQSGSTTVLLSFNPGSAAAASRTATVETAFQGDPTATSPFTVNLRGEAYTTVTEVNGTGLPLAIPDGVAAGVTSNATVTTLGKIAKVAVTLHNVSHTAVGNLQITLIHPNGTPVRLINTSSNGGDHFAETVFDDSAPRTWTSAQSTEAPFTARWIPEQPGGFAILNTLSANGVWQLNIADPFPTDTGTLNSWSLTVATDPIVGIDVREGSGTGNVLTSGAAAAGTAFAFGDRLAAASATATIFIRNSGNAPLNLSSLQLTGDAAFTLVPSSFATSQLAGGQSTTVDVRFTSSAVSAANVAVTANAQFAHTDPAIPSPFVVNATGRVTAPVLEVTDGVGGSVVATGGTIAYGNQGTNDGPSAQRILVVRNTGLAPLTIGAATATGATAEFTTDATTQFPATIPAGGSVQVTSRFDPSSAGAKQVSISFTHDGFRQAGTFTAQLTGTGVGTISTGGGGTGSGGGGGGGGCSAGGQTDTSTPVLLGALLAAYALRRVRRREVVS